jgi:hypothetical protein
MNPTCAVRPFGVFAAGSHPATAPITLGGNSMSFSRSGQFSGSVTLPPLFIVLPVQEPHQFSDAPVYNDDFSAQDFKLSHYRRPVVS